MAPIKDTTEIPSLGSLRSAAHPPSGRGPAVDNKMNASRSGSASIRKALKEAEARHKQEIQDDLRQIDANFLRSRGDIINDLRVANGLPPLEVATWDVAKVLVDRELPNSSRKPLFSLPVEKVLARKSGRKGKLLTPEVEVEEENLGCGSSGVMKRKEVPNSTDDEEESGGDGVGKEPAGKKRFVGGLRFGSAGM